MMLRKAFAVLVMSFGLMINFFPFSHAYANIHQPSVDVRAIQANSPTTLTVSTYIPDLSLLPSSVNLLRVDSQGKTIATLGSLNDNGVNGDLKAGDRIYSIQVILTEPQAGQVYLKISAALKGMLKRIASDIFTVKVYLPQDDEDHDGLPDGWEYAHFGDLSHDGNDDADQDGLSNLEEFYNGTDPRQADTDGDGYASGEVTYTYDNLGRLEYVSSSYGHTRRTIHFVYDDVGNLISRTVTVSRFE
jgi:hypothetical protein